MTEPLSEKKSLLKKRYVYVLLFSMPALLAAIIISLLLFGGAAGMLWLFVLGDNPWPATADHLLTALLVLSFLGVWTGFMFLAYVFGKKQESEESLNTKHVMHSIRATAIMALFVVVYQWNIGNIGPKSDGELCADYCAVRGFSGSSMSPRDAGAVMCSCVDTQGEIRIKASLGEVMLEQRQ